jgi:hypothetical protein
LTVEFLDYFERKQVRDKQIEYEQLATRYKEGFDDKQVEISNWVDDEGNS